MLLTKKRSDLIIYQIREHFPNVFVLSIDNAKLSGTAATETTCQIHVTALKSPGNKIDFTPEQLAHFAALVKGFKLSFFSIRRIPTIIIS
jgi:hypothetical protein